MFLQRHVAKEEKILVLIKIAGASALPVLKLSPQISSFGNHASVPFDSRLQVALVRAAIGPFESVYRIRGAIDSGIFASTY